MRRIRFGDIEYRALDIDRRDDRRVVAALDGDRYRGRVGVAALVSQRVGEGFRTKLTGGKEAEGARVEGEGARGTDQQIGADRLVRRIGRQDHRGHPVRVECKSLSVHLGDGQQRVEAVGIEILARRAAGLGQPDDVFHESDVLVHRVDIVNGHRRIIDVGRAVVGSLVAARHVAARTVGLAAIVAIVAGVGIVAHLLEAARAVQLRPFAERMRDDLTDVRHRDLVLEQVEPRLGDLHRFVGQRVDDPLVADGLDGAEDLAARLVDDEVAADLA